MTNTVFLYLYGLESPFDTALYGNVFKSVINLTFFALGY